MYVRVLARSCTMFKIVQGLFHFPNGNFVEQTPRVTRSQSHHLLICPHTSSFYNSFVPRTIHNWNMFTAHVPLASYPGPFEKSERLIYPYLLLYHPLNLIFGHTCEICYCIAILCAINAKIFIEKKKKTKF